jgi:hypothetical protein
LWGKVDVFSERFANPLIDGVFHKNTVFVFGGVGGTGEVAGETSSGKAGETSKTVIKEATATDLFKLGIGHKRTLNIGLTGTRKKLAKRLELRNF